MKTPLLIKGFFAVAVAGAATAGALGLAQRPATSLQVQAPASRPALAAITQAGMAAPLHASNAGRGGGSFSSPDAVFQAKYGSGPAELGVLRPKQGARYCPSAIAVDAGGTVHVLDQVNGRVMSLSQGRPPITKAIDRLSYQDLAIATDGTLVLADTRKDGVISFFDVGTGTHLREVALLSNDIPEPALISNVFANPTGVWVELEHQQLLHVATPQRTPARGTAPGRFTHDGNATLRASVDVDDEVTIERTPVDGSPGTSVTVSFPRDVVYVRDLETDAQNRVFLAAVIADEDESTGKFDDPATMVVALTEDLREIARIRMPETDSPDDQVRPIAIGDDGSVFHLACGQTAATLWRTSL